MALDQFSDEILISKAREGEVSAFEELFNRYKKAILNFIYRLIGSRETAEEVTQEVFVNVYKNLDIFDIRKKFSPWLYTIARNLARNSLRDKRYFRDRSLDETIQDGDEKVTLKDVIADDGSRPDAIVEGEELEAQAQQILNELPLEYREIITLCSIQGLSHKEAADIIGCSEPTITARLNKAKILFMKRLGAKDV